MSPAFHVAPSTAAGAVRVLLVEDNPGDARLIVEMLREVSDQFSLQRADRLDTALEQLSQAGVDIVLLDLGLPDSQGIDTFVRTRRGAGTEPIIVISGLDDEELALEAVRAGAQDYLVKGRIEGHGLARVIRHAIERQRLDVRLRWLTLAVDQSPASVFITDPQGTIQYVNAKFTEVTGYSAPEAVGKTPRILKSGLTPPEYYQRLWTALRTGETWRSEIQNRRKSGELYWDSVVVSPIRDSRGEVVHFLAVQEDITAHKQLERQYRQAQKMEAVGRLAGGVAHDFNNLLTAIFGYADLLAEDLAPDHPGRDDLNEIRVAATRASSLTRQLLAFSRQQVLQPVVLNLNDVVENIQKMLQSLLGEDVKLHATLADDLGNVRADVGQIEQVIMNLAVNSRDAMPTGGQLTIETANVELDEEYAEAHPPVPPGRFVMLAVSDTGTGMDDATKAKVFEPFFTTKEAGKGTGLGLATVYGIVKQSEGFIWLYSEPGRGATFKIYLPRVDAPLDPPVRAPELIGSVAGTETVLLAEDDTLLLPLARDLLTKLGYRLLEARDSDEALAAARAHAGEIQLLVTDVVMPGGGGFQLAQQLIAERPTMRVLFMSGYTDEAVVRHGLLERGLNYLQKPFTPAVLARRVRDMLDAG